MAPNQLTWLWAVPSLLASFVIGAPTTTGGQYVLQAGKDGRPLTSQRQLHGRFLHITDLHPDEFYKVHTSTEENIACHRGHGPAGTYGAETSDCDSPLALVDATLDWITANLKDSIDFVVWTGDSARHDSDEKTPRHNKDILAMNRRIADSFVKTFSDDKGLVVPVVPTFGNNDIYPHNVLMPGPNDILRAYTDVWRAFIPEDQRHSFEFGGWFYVEVIPNKLAVFSLNTLYFFDRNAGVDDCAHPSEPGYQHFEWLRIQLQFLRERGMKAILMGHVPPARTSGKQLWDETCWQKYTLWLQQYRDVVISSLYGHMNIDHFLLQDTKEIDFSYLESTSSQRASIRETMEDEISVESSKDYLMELREDWAKLPDPVQTQDFGEFKKKKKGNKKKKLGGPWAERYQLTLISPSVVPNYLPTLRVFEYNITGIEDTPTWVDTVRKSGVQSTSAPDFEMHSLELRGEPNVEIEKKKKKKKGKHGKDPNIPPVQIPDAPAKGSLPGPGYYPQPLTLKGYIQYYANLTMINNDITADNIDGDELSSSKWDAGKHKDKKPKYTKPQPKEFGYEIEYTTFDDKIYKLKDLTVKSFLRLAHRIGQTSTESTGLGEIYDDYEEENDDDEVVDNEVEDVESIDEEENSDGLDAEKKKKKKKGGHKMRNTKIWLHFLKHAFVSTKSIDELKDIK
ncbi:Endopolyphosphatase [Annulohypoxylon maeteangense]|uniref:Endopolyphosphatase n=1 Tax=Annulohypoxylon maeteangense TaxID=1927788 RepID=UPI002007C2F3|nr:Endopolyphosphatase [Annulohypoxylon maeteangense]KAI0890627.1 Endopolyphosphatase [Annulohypoxylon maeteangense]